MIKLKVICREVGFNISLKKGAIDYFDQIGRLIATTISCQHPCCNILLIFITELSLFVQYNILLNDRCSFICIKSLFGVYECVIFIYTKKKVKHPHVFFKWQMMRQVSRDYWPDNLKNAILRWPVRTLHWL